jgi:hypothetical protein
VKQKRRHCDRERSVAGSNPENGHRKSTGLLRRFAPRNDAIFSLCSLRSLRLNFFVAFVFFVVEGFLRASA